jgi:hypothetical protein
MRIKTPLKEYKLPPEGFSFSGPSFEDAFAEKK